MSCPDFESAPSVVRLTQEITGQAFRDRVFEVAKKFKGLSPGFDVQRGFADRVRMIEVGNEIIDLFTNNGKVADQSSNTELDNAEV